MTNMKTMQSKYNTRCRCGCKNTIRRGTTIGYSNTRWGVGWLRLACAVELDVINRCDDIYTRRRLINVRMGIEPDVKIKPTVEKEPDNTEWLEEDLLCEDVYTSFLFVKENSNGIL